MNNFDIFYNLFLNNKNFKDLEILSKNIDFILPLLIHLNKEKQRGYNQSDRSFPICYNIPYKKNIFKKIKDIKFFLI